MKAVVALLRYTNIRITTICCLSQAGLVTKNWKSKFLLFLFKKKKAIIQQKENG